MKELQRENLSLNTPDWIEDKKIHEVRFCKAFLAQHPNRVFTREQLLDRIWGYEYVGDTRTVDVHVKRIREKLNSEDEWGILTVWSVGYKFGQK